MILLTRFLFIFSILVLSSFSNDKIYLNSEEMDLNQNLFHVHTGNNIWMQCDTVFRDETGMYTLQCNLNTLKGEYQKSWKCPYCFHYWPIGTPCQNADCPSKYK